MIPIELGTHEGMSGKKIEGSLQVGDNLFVLHRLAGNGPIFVCRAAMIEIRYGHNEAVAGYAARRGERELIDSFAVMTQDEGGPKLVRAVGLDQFHGHAAAGNIDVFGGLHGKAPMEHGVTDVRQ